jgi:UDP-glucose 4-epimerase
MIEGTVLITGGCGFIGSSLVARLRRNEPGLSIRVLDNLSVGSLDDLSEVCSIEAVRPGEDASGDHVGFIEGDVRDATMATECCKGVSAIVHLAGQTGVPTSLEDPWADLEQNVVGTFNLLEGARRQGVPRFVFASSGAPAGLVEPPIHEDLPARPISPYGASKLACEGYCCAYAASFGVGTVALRFGNVYGPRSKRKSSVVAKFIRQALDGTTCEVYGDGSQTRDFIFVDDLLEAIIAAWTADVSGELFQIATSRERTISEVAEVIQQQLHDLAGVEMVLRHVSERKGDMKRNFSDTSKAERVLGWRAGTPLEDGISQTIRYFLNSA